LKGEGKTDFFSCSVNGKMGALHRIIFHWWRPQIFALWYILCFRNYIRHYIICYIWSSHTGLDRARTVDFVEFLLCLTNMCTKYLLTFISYNSHRMWIPKYHHQGAIRMLKLQSNWM
jgi:hypothetical protein